MWRRRARRRVGRERFIGGLDVVAFVDLGVDHDLDVVRDDDGHERLRHRRLEHRRLGPDDACGEGAPGTCEPKPQGCDAIYDPVCGCDGNTYGNDCEAAAMGIDYQSQGVCGGVNDCGDGFIDPGAQCDGADLQGFDCQSLGLVNGTLACDPVTCTFDTSMCG